MSAQPPPRADHFDLAEEPMLKEVFGAAAELREALAKLGAHNLAVFGSVARGEEGPQSDIDLLVDLDPQAGLFALLKMQRVARELLGRPVDIVPREALKREVGESALREAVPL